MVVPDRDRSDETSRDDREQASFLNRMVGALAEEDERENEDLASAMGADSGTEVDSSKDCESAR